MLFFGARDGVYCTPSHFKFNKTFEILAVFAVLLSIPFLRQSGIAVALMLSSFHDFTVWNEVSTGGIIEQALFIILGSVFTFLLASFIWKLMVPLGARLAFLINEDASPLFGYSVNIGGSLIGIWLFSGLCYLSLPPVAWFLVLGILGLPLALKDLEFGKKGYALLFLIILFPTVGYFLEPAQEFKWSPYQKLEIFPSKETPTEFDVRVNNTGYQQIQNNNPEFVKTHSPEYLDDHGVMSQYDIPGRLVPTAKDILIVGAGTGNDVAGALRSTKGAITAVEIDPVILDFGKRYHPEHPYDSSRVHFIVDDARAAFMRLDKKFDLIVFGLLDSHSTPALTNTRLDHYVYTIESLTQASRLLKPDGVFVVIFQPQREYIVLRLAQTLGKVFNSPPISLNIDGSPVGWGGVLYVAGNQSTIDRALASDSPLKRFVTANQIPPKKLELPLVQSTTDNWPYLYLEKPSVPMLFVLLAGMLALLWFRSSKEVLGTTRLSSLLDKESPLFISMGVGFSLFEVYGVNQAAILFGSSWIVNGIVISSILIMILLANIIQQNFNLFRFRRALFLLLIVVLVGIYFINLSNFIALSSFSKLALGFGIFGGPMFFSGINFAAIFERAKNRGTALGANLFGALIGGIFQLTTFPCGIKSLLILSSFSYLCAWYFARTEVVVE